MATNNNGATTKIPGISGAALKWIALACMMIDHVGALLLLPMYNDQLRAITAGLTQEQMAMTSLGDYPGLYALYMIYWLCRLIGRLAFPIYAFLLVEGFRHTSNTWKYFLRLLIFAIITEVPFDLAVFGKVGFETFSYQNILLMMALGVLCLIIIEKVRKIEKFTLPFKLLAFVSYFVFGVMVVYLVCTSTVGLLFVERPADQMQILLFTNSEFLMYAAFGGCIAATIFLFLSMKRDQVKMMQFGLSAAVGFAFMIISDLTMTDFHAWGIAAILIFYFMSNGNMVKKAGFGSAVLIGFDFLQMAGIAATLPISKYNGERGKQNKYFFYILYPVQFLLFFGLRELINVFIK